LKRRLWKTEWIDYKNCFVFGNIVERACDGPVKQLLLERYLSNPANMVMPAIENDLVIG